MSHRSFLLEDKFHYSRGLKISFTSSIHQVWGLHIIYSYAIKSLSNNILRSLEKLEISYCYAIKALPNSLPVSLKNLEISNCEALKSLPKNDLPSSMLELHVLLLPTTTQEFHDGPWMLREQLDFHL
ncbi:hypothetical protein VPH35_001726 [Triticum aestivum]